MKTSPLPKDVDKLLTFAESIAAVLSEYRDELDIRSEVEALLRASIAAATFSIDSYIAVLAGANKSPVAMSHLATARLRCDRDLKQLRRRVARSNAELRRHMKDRVLDYCIKSAV